MKKCNRYQVIYNTVVCGEACVCLCTTKTAMGTQCICYSEEEANKRLTELLEIGVDAWIEPLPYGEAWFDDNNWIG